MTAIAVPPLPSRKITKRAGNPPLSGIVASATTVSDSIVARRNCATASAATVTSGGSHVRTAAAAPLPTSKAGSCCASLASSIAARRRFARRNDVELAGDLRIGRQREDRRHIVQIAERETGRSRAVETERPGAARGDEKVRPRRARTAAERGQSLLGQAVDRHQHRSAVMRRHDDRPSRPELGKAPLHSDLFGRAKQAGTPTRHSCHPTHLGRQHRSRLDQTRTRPSGFYSIGDVFFATVCSHPPTKYHGTMQRALKAGIR